MPFELVRDVEEEIRKMAVAVSEEEKEKMSKLEYDHMMIKMSSRIPGFKFSPGEEELISFYLRKKIVEKDELVSIIPELDQINNFEPWDLPAKCSIYSEREWYYFSPRGRRKYPNGSTQSKRATESGYWKATGRERNVYSGSTVIGTKRALVFHTGRAPNGERTEWTMHEFAMKDQPKDSMVIYRLRKSGDEHITDIARQINEPNSPVVDDVHDPSGSNDDNINGEEIYHPEEDSCSSTFASYSVDQQNDSDLDSD